MGIAESALKRFAGLEPFPQPKVLPLEQPVVLMHGFGMLASIRRAGMLHDIAMHLRKHGVRAYAPNVAPYETVPRRAEQWQHCIERVLEETHATKVHLVAHSMGGLDARYLISALGMHDRVATLTTISTPHHGTALADFVLEQPERLQSLITDIANWMGSTILETASANFLQAVSELTPTHMQEMFNALVLDRPEVSYRSYAGQAGRETTISINPLLRVLNLLLHNRQGINDGLVPNESAHWGDFRGTLDADHLQQVGHYLGSRKTFNAEGFYLDLMQDLVNEGY